MTTSQHKHQRIFFVGHCGAGKGLLAKALAKKLGWKFIDADFALSPVIGRDLNEILGQQGEDAFQNCLTDILLQQRALDNVVVATDEAIVCNEKNRDILSKEFTVYVKVSIPVQLERTSQDRPLLKVADFNAFLERLHKERDALYEQCAKYTLSSDDGDIEKHVSLIFDAMQS